MSRRAAQIQALRRARPRDRFLRWSLIAVGCLVAYSLFAGEFFLSDLFDTKSREKFARFLEFVSDPDEPDSPRAKAREKIYSKTASAALTTLSISVASIVLAGLGAAVLSGFAARNLVSPQPFIHASRPPGLVARWLWRAISGLTRAILIFTRAIPEYIWAFLLIGIFGLGAWPAVLALALHNLGILGRLGAETIENQSEETPAALRGLGASRVKIYLTDLVPNALLRWLVYFFYRWETCLREATVLGMLGITSLGYLIMNEARPREFFDVMIVLTLVGAGLVFLADLISALIRWRLRKAF